MTSIEKLRWQCRRGVKELDLLLQSYLDTGYLQADAEEKKQFAELLKWEDDELLVVLLGGKDADEGKTMFLLEKIRAISVAGIQGRCRMS